MATGTIKVTGAGAFLVENITVEDNVSLAANATYSGNNISVSKTGYLPLGVVGFRLDNASSGGSNPQIIYPYAIQFFPDSQEVRFRLKNQNTSTSAKIKILADILYIRI